MAIIILATFCRKRLLRARLRWDGRVAGNQRGVGEDKWCQTPRGAVALCNYCSRQLKAAGLLVPLLSFSLP